MAEIRPYKSRDVVSRLLEVSVAGGLARADQPQVRCSLSGPGARRGPTTNSIGRVHAPALATAKREALNRPRRQTRPNLSTQGVLLAGHAAELCLLRGEGIDARWKMSGDRRHESLGRRSVGGYVSNPSERPRDAL